MRLKIFLICVVVVSFYHSKVIACASDEPTIFQESPPYIDPHYFKPTKALDIILEQYFHEALREPEYPKEHMSFLEYQEEIKDLEQSKNLIPLISDYLQWPSHKGYGSCESNNNETALNFIKAVFSDPQVKEGYQDLIQIRHDMLSFCGQQMKESDLLTRIQNLDGKKVGGYKQYLEATFYFYAQEYEKALEIYSALKKNTPSPQSNWLKETATYMEARTLLIWSQKNWDGLGSPAGKVIDKDMLLRSLKLFQAYLKEYPKGLYSNSAKNIQRKIFLLLEDQEHLNEGLREAVNQQLATREKGEEGDNNPTQTFKDVMSEFSQYFKGSSNPAVDSPIIVVFDVLQQATPSKDLLQVLAREEKRFTPYPGLYQFLRAWVLYKLGLFQEVLEVVPSSSSLDPKDMLEMSMEILRARSLWALNKDDEAIKVLENMTLHIEDFQRKFPQLELVCLQFARGHKFDLFLSDVPLNHELLNDIIEVGLSNEELSQFSEDPRLEEELQSRLTQALMERYLVLGQLKDARALFERADPADLGRFMPLKPYVIKLVDSPQDNESLLEFGRILFELGLYLPYEKTVSDTLDGLKKHCSTWSNQSYKCDSLFKERTNYKESVPPFEYFLQVIKSESKFEAEALHYLVARCFQRGMDSCSCQWNKDYENKSPQWFRKLHKKYKGSIWAKKTPYHY